MADVAFNRIMGTVTSLAAAVIFGGLLAAIWDAITWATYGKASLTAVIVWLPVVVIAGMLRSRHAARRGPGDTDA